MRCLRVGLALGLAGCVADDIGESAVVSAATDTDADTGTGADTDQGPEPAGPDAAPDPAVPGPFAVGVQTLALSDPQRERPITIEVWYPATDDANGGAPVVYTIDDLLRPDARHLVEAEVDASLATTAVRDVPVHVDAGPFPLVLFSHGSGGVRIQSTYLTVALASHGYVVVAPDHFGNTLSDVLIAGDLSIEDLVESIPQRTGDLDFLVEWLETMDPAEPFAAATDLSRIGVAGHSLGALTSVRWAGLGAPVQAVVSQAPPPMEITWFGVSTPLLEVDAALMLQVGGMDMTTPPEDAESVWVEASAPRSKLTLGDAGHFTFSDLCLLDVEAIVGATDSIADALDDGCAPTNTDPQAAAAVLRHFTIGHFNAYLRGSAPTFDVLTEAAGQALAGAGLTFESER